MLSHFDVIALASPTLKLLVVFMILHYITIKVKKGEAAVAYASRVKR